MVVPAVDARLVRIFSDAHESGLVDSERLQRFLELCPTVAGLHRLSVGSARPPVATSCTGDGVDSKAIAARKQAVAARLSRVDTVLSRYTLAGIDPVAVLEKVLETKNVQVNRRAAVRDVRRSSGITQV